MITDIFKSQYAASIFGQIVGWKKNVPRDAGLKRNVSKLAKMDTSKFYSSTKLINIFKNKLFLIREDVIPSP